MLRKYIDIASIDFHSKQFSKVAISISVSMFVTRWICIPEPEIHETWTASAPIKTIKSRTEDPRT